MHFNVNFRHNSSSLQLNRHFETNVWITRKFSILIHLKWKQKTAVESNEFEVKRNGVIYIATFVGKCTFLQPINSSIVFNEVQKMTSLISIVSDSAPFLGKSTCLSIRILDVNGSRRTWIMYEWPGHAVKMTSIKLTIHSEQ